MSAAHPGTDRRDVTAIEDAAADWLARRQTGFAPGEEPRFQAWHAADPRHAAAFAALERTWAVLNRPRATGHAAEARDALRTRARRRTKRRLAWGFGLAGCAAAAALALMFTPGFRRTDRAIPAVTAVVRPNVRTLEDGSRVTLNAGAEIAVEFSPGRRDVRLVRGEALFAVAKDAQRPFIVTAAGVAVRAVGTEFSVRYAPSRIDVLVTEGHVSVDRVEADDSLPPAGRVSRPATPTLGAGELAMVPLAVEEAPTRRKVEPAEIAAALAWRDKRIEFNGTPLAEAAAFFNRHNPVQLVMADAATGRLKITGVAWTDDPEGFARLIEAGLELRAQRSGDSIVLRQSAGGEKSR